MIKIDGSMGEGGGQIVRTACSLSAITGQPCHVSNIRQMADNNKAGGLRAQHLGAIRALQEMCSAEVQGVQFGSPEITFKPGVIRGKKVKVEIKTAGSVTLVLHTLLPPALFGDSKMEIIIDGGATDTFFSPTINHFCLVFLNLIRKMGVRAETNIRRRGFYPKGGALVETTAQPSILKTIKLVNPGKLQKVTAYSGATDDLQNKKVAERQLSGLKQVLGKLKLPLEEKTTYHKTNSTGSYLDVIVQTERSVFGVNALGKMGKSAEEVGQEAAQNFLREIRTQAPLDQHTADQLLPYIALAGKESRIRASQITEHARTNMKIIEMFLPGRFEVRDTTIGWQPA